MRPLRSVASIANGVSQLLTTSTRVSRRKLRTWAMSSIPLDLTESPCNDAWTAQQTSSRHPASRSRSREGDTGALREVLLDAARSRFGAWTLQARRVATWTTRGLLLGWERSDVLPTLL